MPTMRSSDNYDPSPKTSISGGIGPREIFFGLAGLVFLIFIGVCCTYTWQTVEGNEIGVRETWSGGVDPEPKPPKTYVIYRWTEHIYTYPTSGQVFVMNDKPTGARGEPFAQGREVDPLIVNSVDSQQMSFHTILTWRISPMHVVNLHKNYRDHIEERLIRPEEVRAVMTRATLQPAIDLYSGEKLNDLRSSVEKELKDPNGKLAVNGVIVDSFVVERPTLDPEYVKKIEARQLAIITESMAKEQKKANDAIADAARSAAQKEANERIVKAEADKQVNILSQEGTSQMAIIQVKAEAQNNVTRQEAESKKVVLAAEAEARRTVAISEAAKQAEINRSIGIKAVGEAEANRNQLLLSSFSVPGSELYTRIKVAEQFAAGLDKVRFYPANATFTTVADNFDKGLSLLIGSGAAVTAPAPVTK